MALWLGNRDLMAWLAVLAVLAYLAVIGVALTTSRQADPSDRWGRAGLWLLLAAAVLAVPTLGRALVLAPIAMVLGIVSLATYRRRLLHVPAAGIVILVAAADLPLLALFVFMAAFMYVQFAPW